MIDLHLLQDISSFLLHIIDSENTTDEQKQVASEIDERVVKKINETDSDDPASMG